MEARGAKTLSAPFSYPSFAKTRRSEEIPALFGPRPIVVDADSSSFRYLPPIWSISRFIASLSRLPKGRHRKRLIRRSSIKNAL